MSSQNQPQNLSLIIQTSQGLVDVEKVFQCNIDDTKNCCQQRRIHSELTKNKQQYILHSMQMTFKHAAALCTFMFFFLQNIRYLISNKTTRGSGCYGFLMGKSVKKDAKNSWKVDLIGRSTAQVASSITLVQSLTVQSKNGV